MTEHPTPRPGGRSRRVKEAVFEAFEALLQEQPEQLPTMARIASEAGVNPTSLYRRWGDVAALAADVAVERLMRTLPVPDSGALKTDLTAWASNAARSLSGPKDGALLRIMATTAHARQISNDARSLPIEPRLAELKTMLTRARDRGEIAPPLWEVLEIVLAPIYLRILFLGPIEDAEAYAASLVARALTVATPN